MEPVRHRSRLGGGGRNCKRASLLRSDTSLMTGVVFFFYRPGVVSLVQVSFNEPRVVSYGLNVVYLLTLEVQVGFIYSPSVVF